MPQAPIFVSATSGSRGEPVEDLARVGDLARAVDRRQPAGLAVAARVEREHGVASRRAGPSPARARSCCRAVAAEPVERRSPASRPAGGVAVRDDRASRRAERRRRSVIVMSCRAEVGPEAAPDQNERGERARRRGRTREAEGHARRKGRGSATGWWSPTIRAHGCAARSACSTPAWAGSPSCTSASSRSRTRTSSTSATARGCPYGPRPLDEIRRFAREIAGYLERQGVKLVVAACNSATAAALPDLQRAALGSRRRRARARRRTQPSSRRATAGSACSRPRRRSRAAATSELVRALDAGAEVVPVACPRLVPLIEGDDPFGEETDGRGARVRRAAEGGGRRHRHPRLHALPADPADPAARLRARRHARLLRRGDRARGGGDARAQGDRERRRPRGRVPLPDDRRSGRRSARWAAASCSSRSSERRSTSRSPRSRRRPREAHDGRRGPTSSARSTSQPDFLEQPHGSVLYAQGKTLVLCTATVEEGVPRWLHGNGPRLDDGRVLAASRPRPASARSAGVARGRPDGRTVEIQRLIGRALRAVVRLRGARRAHALARLRRAPGRRRHALRLDHGRLGRRAPRARPLRALEGAHRLGRRGLGRDRRRRGRARPRLRGGLERRDRHERRHDRRRPARRGAGDRRARPVLARAARRAARPRRGRNRRARGAQQAKPPPRRAREGSLSPRATRTSSSSCGAALPGWEIELARRADESGRGRRDVPRERTDQGAPRARCTRRRTPGSLGEDSGIEATRWRAAGDRSPRAGPTTASRGCSPSSTASRTGARGYVCELVVISPDGVELAAEGTLEGSSRPRRAGAKASATTRSSSRAASR